MPKISVIVPVYNVERYLEECLNSIINQTFSDIEIICVNDGSTDNSAEILKKYEKQDNRIKIVNKKNGGLSSARNIGMQFATGEFISFIDSDDWVDKTMLEKMYNNITTLNADISICAVHNFDEQKQEIDDSLPYFTLALFNATFDNKVFSYADTKDFIMDVCVMAWNKLYRKSFLDECKATFPDGLIFEDGPFFFSIFFKTQKVSIVREFLYYYRINRTGSILQKHNKNLMDIIDIVNLMYEEISQTPIWEDIKHTFYKKKADDIFYRYQLIPFKYKKKFAKKFREESYLADEENFDFNYIKENMPITYTNMNVLKTQANFIILYLQKIKLRLMYKVIQILCTEQNRYYFKFWAVKFWLKKRPNLLDVWYENDKIFIIIFKKIKFNFKFEFSKI